MRTTVSKKYRSATSFAPFPNLRRGRTFSSTLMTSSSPSLGTYGRMRLTFPASNAFRAAVTTGPSIESQCGGMFQIPFCVCRIIDAPGDLQLLYTRLYGFPLPCQLHLGSPGPRQAGWNAPASRICSGVDSFSGHPESFVSRRCPEDGEGTTTLSEGVQGADHRSGPGGTLASAVGT